MSTQYPQCHCGRPSGFSLDTNPPMCGDCGQYLGYPPPGSFSEIDWTKAISMDTLPQGPIPIDEAHILDCHKGNRFS